MLGYLLLAYTFISRLDLQSQNISRDGIFVLNVAKEVEKFARNVISHAGGQLSGGGNSHYF